MNQKPAIAGKRTLIISGILIVLGLAVLGIALFRVQDLLHGQERKYMLTVARSTAASIHNFVDGYLSNVLTVTEHPHFRRVVEAYRRDGRGEAILEYLRTLTSDSLPAATEAYWVDGDGNILLGATSEAYTRIQGEKENPGDGQLRIYKNAAGNLFLGIESKFDDDGYVTLLIDIDQLYWATSSFVTLGHKGYVMLKHSSGLVITHPLKEQRWTDVIEDRRTHFPDLDCSDLEALIESQKSSREGISVYYSYWREDGRPQRLKKISAYASVPLQNDFLIVSAVNDYAELGQPILLSSGAMAAAAIFMTLGVVSLLLGRRRENQLQIQRENAYLKELNRRQEESQHNQRLQMIGTLTGGIAHEFRNLLTPIMGYSGMMRESLPPDSPWRDEVDEIYSSAARAKEIIQQVTSLSRKNLEPVLNPVGLDDLLPGILKVVSTFKPADVTMQVQADFGGREILGNKTQLNQIILNLCNNAFQAMPKGGNLWIGGEIIREGAERQAVLTFKDDGEGIDPADLPRIFDPFFTTKRVGEGTGLGLSMVQNIVELHLGSIDVASRPGEGSTFTLRFPVVRTDVSKRRAPSSMPRNGEEILSIVLVEDDPEVLKMLHRGLVKSGFTVQALGDPLEALREIERNPASLLITDYNLPGLNGAELAKRVRAIAPKTRILILTGVADAEIQEYVGSGAVDAYQIKPVPVSELVERINFLFADRG